MSNAKNVPLLGSDDLISVSQKITSFSKLLDGMETLSEKKKELWKQIYTNAVIDRSNALICYNDLLGKALQSSTEHAIHAQSISKYIERMSRANDQLIKLAEMIAEAERKEDEMNPEDIYSALEGEDS